MSCGRRHIRHRPPVIVGQRTISKVALAKTPKHIFNHSLTLGLPHPRQQLRDPTNRVPLERNGLSLGAIDLIACRIGVRVVKRLAGLNEMRRAVYVVERHKPFFTSVSLTGR